MTINICLLGEQSHKIKWYLFDKHMNYSDFHIFTLSISSHTPVLMQADNAMSHNNFIDLVCKTTAGSGKYQSVNCQYYCY